jgi:hypothetical protein
MQISFHILPNLILRTEPGYSRLQYKRSVDDVLGVKLNYSETQNYFDLPLRLLIGKQFSNSWIYAGIGTSAFFMGNAYGLLLSEDISTGNKILNSFDVKDSRKPVSLTADFGAGFEMKAGSGRLGFSVFRSQSFGNLMQETKRYEDMFMVLSTKYIENDFKLNSMRMQLYYQIPLSYRVIKK